MRTDTAQQLASAVREFAERLGELAESDPELNELLDELDDETDDEEE